MPQTSKVQILTCSSPPPREWYIKTSVLAELSQSLHRRREPLSVLARTTSSPCKTKSRQDDHNEGDHNEEGRKSVQIEARKSKVGGTSPPVQRNDQAISPQRHSRRSRKISRAREIARSRTQNKHKKDKETSDKQHRTPHYEVNDLVLVKIIDIPTQYCLSELLLEWIWSRCILRQTAVGSQVKFDDIFPSPSLILMCFPSCSIMLIPAPPLLRVMSSGPLSQLKVEAVGGGYCDGVHRLFYCLVIFSRLSSLTGMPPSLRGSWRSRSHGVCSP
ncbi:hypothetical protein LAZ67_1001750 [Cordylochernes scorpioides]|uniref:Uncharacterized protein n=1 Tax=Cordylochernes scorpioides TaxID=51811 RepID=A0ABY6JYC9_9ARAC|nr:hypothetical protein LAZ67_1001750 [Cordylochernes scorpioides]